MLLEISPLALDMDSDDQDFGITKLFANPEGAVWVVRQACPIKDVPVKGQDANRNFLLGMVSGWLNSETVQM